MDRYEEVKDVHAETWSRIYRYKVASGVCIAVMTLAKHIPSNITIAGHGVLGTRARHQPMTCYRCHETGHFHQACPVRRTAGEIGHTAATTSWADIAVQEAGGTRRGREAVEEVKQRKKGSRRKRAKYMPTKRDHATRKVKGYDTYLGRRRQAEVTP